MKNIQLNFISYDNSQPSAVQPAIWTLYLDGAARNNPGPAGAGIHLLKDGQTVSREGFYLGSRTNNQAEYLALLLGLYFLHEYCGKDDKVRVISDSELLVKQIRGEYKVKNEILKKLFSAAQELLKAWPVSILHVMREDNKIADSLANLGIDKKKPVPPSFITVLKKYDVTW